jgi:phage-related minor tail protein
MNKIDILKLQIENCQLKLALLNSQLAEINRQGNDVHSLLQKLEEELKQEGSENGSSST